MGLFGDLSNAIKQKDKEVHLRRRKKRQKRKQQEAKYRGDTKTVARYSAAKKKTNKKRKVAQKEFVKSTVKSGVGVAKVGLAAAQGDVLGAAIEFI
tara:strand:- start:47 stop:334 length:288 start_codon:yes stop_codon:yes gene_type:complete